MVGTILFQTLVFTFKHLIDPVELLEYGRRYHIIQTLVYTFKLLIDPVELLEYNGRYHMGHVVRKPVFGVTDKARFKPVSSATESI